MIPGFEDVRHPDYRRVMRIPWSRKPALTPVQRIPVGLRDVVAVDGVPDWYDGSLYTADNGADAVAREIDELVRAATEAGDALEPEDETGPLPAGFGQSPDSAKHEE